MREGRGGPIRDPDDAGRGDAPNDDPDAPEGDPLAPRTDDAPPPVSPTARHTATIVALVFVAVIVTFLVWFISTNTERSEDGTFFGAAESPAEPTPNPRRGEPGGILGVRR